MVKMAPYTEKYISIKVTRFYMKVVGFWYPDSHREKWILHAALAYTILAVIFAIAVEGTDLYFSWGDFNAVAENACCTMPLIVIAIKVIVFMIRRDVVVDLIKFSEKNFWMTTYDDFGERIMKECEKRGVILSYTLSLSVQATVICYVTSPLIENIGRNDTERFLPFRLWVDLPIKVTPYYEIIYVIQSLSTIHSGICFFCFDNMMGILNIHVVGQFKILQHRLQKLCDKSPHSRTFGANLMRKTEEECLEYGEQEQCWESSEDTHNELKKCVQQHLILINYVQKLEQVFSFILLCQMGVSSLFMCLGGFQIYVGSQSKRVTFVLHLLSAFSQILLFTWTCNEIIVESAAVAEAAFYARWYMMPDTKMGHSVRHGLKMVMIRARKACYISAGKFTPMSLNTFTSILSTTLSYFTLMRQVSETHS